ncbi:MAG: GNAT family N-acetyltransferase [Candidatus Gracilibacteria bacterium]|nr:GNAT family N-acetyltransferase [Candidatus Gracilibacteria bacterium]
MNITIFPANPSDAIFISEINSQTWFDTYKSEEYGITEELVKSFPEDNEGTTAFIKRKEKEISDNLGSYFLVRDDEKVIGYANGKIYPTKPFNELSGIYLLPEYQRQGIGTQLAEMVLNYLGKEKDVIVEVVGYNQRAINFYKKLGFVFVQELEKFEITDGIWVPEVRMLKKISRD